MTQVYLIVKPTEKWQDVNDMKLWMSNNMLKLNKAKTELIVFAPRSHLFGKNIIHSFPSMKNLGAFFFIKSYYLKSSAMRSQGHDTHRFGK